MIQLGCYITSALKQCTQITVMLNVNIKSIKEGKDMQISPVIPQYEPLRWPPSIELAKMHTRCSCPGTDNTEGMRCPCCQRLQKLATRRWYSRDIIQDFKSYGGGIPSYFSLMKYCAITLLILAALINFYHIYVLESTCPSMHREEPSRQCQTFLFIFKLCDPALIYEALILENRDMEASIFLYLQLVSFVYLICATVGMKIWLQMLNRDKITKYVKIYSQYSVMLKNIPKYQTLESLRKHLLALIPNLQICELIFVWDIAELQQKHKSLFDLHFTILHTIDSTMENQGGPKNLNGLLRKYVKLYEQTQELYKKIGQNNGRAILVCNNRDQRDQLLKYLSMNECRKSVFYSLQLLKVSTRKLDIIADEISEPDEIIWKYVGQSSAKKTQVRIQTSAIGMGFLLIAFSLLYFPILKINQTNIVSKSLFSTILSLIVSVVLQMLAIGYRQIIMRLLPKRRPSSRDSQSYFVVIATVIFHFLFYLVVPISYYVIDLGGISRNLKLKQLFIAVLTFLLMTVLIGFLDIRHRLFNRERKKLLNQYRWWGRYCQARLHELLSWPVFPIQFKLMVLLNIWSFNAYYVFQIPYLLLVFVFVITIIYWIDKRNLYKHYKMHAYLSIELELSVQRDYIFFFLVCACCGYAVSAIYWWQYVLAAAMFAISILTNSILNCRARRQELRELRMSRTITLHQIKLMQQHYPNKSKVALLDRLMGMHDERSNLSLGSRAQSCGYQQLYNRYLEGFKDRRTRQMLHKTYRHCLRRLTDMKDTTQTHKETELTVTISDSVRNDSLVSQKEGLLMQAQSEAWRTPKNRTQSLN